LGDAEVFDRGGGAVDGLHDGGAGGGAFVGIIEPST
jgi:hypothetical protein